jgi:nicotinamide phosphoribosyltransferase
MSFKPFAPTACDAYKLHHHKMLDLDTTTVYSNGTPRSTKHSPIPSEYDDGKVVVFGMTFVLNEMVALWNETFFSVPWEEVEPSLREVVTPFVGDAGFEEGVANFKDLHDLGFLPLHFKALPEGVVVPVKVPVFTVRNSLDRFYWLVGYIETYLSQQFWKMSTVATISRAYYKIISDFARQTGITVPNTFELNDFTRYQGHDFSARGLSGVYDNAMVGAAHLTSFLGTDSLVASQLIREFYNDPNTLIATSVPATEHSIMTSKGVEGELGLFRDLIKTYDSGVLAIVSDSYDFWKVMTEFTVALKEEILARNYNSLGLSKVVFRPDSGDPADTICGTAIPLASTADISNITNYTFDMARPNNMLATVQNFVVSVENDSCYYDVTCRLNSNRSGYFVSRYESIEPTPEMKGAIECLYDVFGGTTNELGYKELCDRVGLIYGDSITLDRADDILSRLKAKGFASNSLVLGVGLTYIGPFKE